MDLNTARAELRYPPVIRFSQILAEAVIFLCIAIGFVVLFT